MTALLFLPGECIRFGRRLTPLLCSSPVPSSSPAGASKEEKHEKPPKATRESVKGLPKRKASYTQKDLESFIDTAQKEDEDDDDLDLADLSSDDDNDGEPETKREKDDDAAAIAKAAKDAAAHAKAKQDEDDDAWMGEKVEGPKTFESTVHVTRPRLNFGAAIKVSCSFLG